MCPGFYFRRVNHVKIALVEQVTVLSTEGVPVLSNVEIYGNVRMGNNKKVHFKVKKVKR